MEQKWETVSPYIDCVITFEELQALFDARDIDIASLPDEHLNNASYYGRIFARSGGLASAVEQALREQGLYDLGDFRYKPVSCDGIRECRTALLKASKGVLQEKLHRGYGVRIGLHRRRGLPDTRAEKISSTSINTASSPRKKTMTDAISVYDFE